ncbi:amidohydrolase family protein [Mycoplasma corogypsi]|uniref:amidohydrolase family protein n=1 Tax=Mycoplasma corogypsi TaxID=2106 RepID=UPI003873398B
MEIAFLVIYQLLKKGIEIYLKGTNTIAGSGICIFDAYKNLLKLGYTESQAVQMTSYNSAQYLKINNLGYVGKNYIADLVELNQHNEIVNVYIDGQVVN